MIINVANVKKFIEANDEFIQVGSDLIVDNYDNNEKLTYYLNNTREKVLLYSYNGKEKLMNIRMNSVIDMDTHESRGYDDVESCIGALIGGRGFF